MQVEDPYQVTTFYCFSRLSVQRVSTLQQQLYDTAAAWQILGLIIIGPEGINSTLAGSPEAIKHTKDFLLEQPEFSSMLFKDSTSHFQPFRRFRIKVRPEIVSLGCMDLVPETQDETHLSPEEWQRVLCEEEGYVVIDTRNDYEVEVGKFRGALNPHIDRFREFPEFVRKSEIPHDKKVLIYCTGGIRCEKAILDMKAAGFENVYQLEGGILRYLQEYPRGEFEGECFVFDHRVAVNAELQPSERYKLCPHCGDPGDVKTVCPQCGKQAVVCDDCQLILGKNTCSKNCAYHYELREGEAQKI